MTHLINKIYLKSSLRKENQCRRLILHVKSRSLEKVTTREQKKLQRLQRMIWTLLFKGKKYNKLDVMGNTLNVFKMKFGRVKHRVVNYKIIHNTSN